jgi:hypothetical protein
MKEILIYIGSILIFIWGVAHIIPTKSVVNGFGKLSKDNKYIITMEWIAEGLTLCFIGSLIFMITIFAGTDNPVSIIVYRASAGMLIIMAVLTSFTGARTAIIPIKICPLIKTIVAILFFIGSII